MGCSEANALTERNGLSFNFNVSSDSGGQAKDAVTLEDRHGKWRVFPLTWSYVPAGGPAGRADPARPGK